MKADLVFFGVPALAVFTAGLVVSGRDGYDGLTPVLWDLVRHPGTLSSLSVGNITGLTLFIIGLTIALVAVFTLRRYYASTLIIREDHKLVTHGVYRLTRNPVYLGVIIACMGVPTYAASVYGFLVMSGLIPLYLNRIRMEERLLAQEFGDAHRRYRETTKKLIPFIY